MHGLEGSNAESASPWMKRAEESLWGAKTEVAAGRYNNAADRCYYAAFQAAIALLEHEGIKPAVDTWRHFEVWHKVDGVLARTEGHHELIGLLPKLQGLRIRADYQRFGVSGEDAAIAIERASQIVETVKRQVSMGDR